MSSVTLSGRNTEGFDSGCVDHWTDWYVSHADKNCCENKAAADHRTKEKKYWLLTAQTPCDYESELF